MGAKPSQRLNPLCYPPIRILAYQHVVEVPRAGLFG